MCCGGTVISEDRRKLQEGVQIVVGINYTIIFTFILNSNFYKMKLFFVLFLLFKFVFINFNMYDRDPRKSS